MFRINAQVADHGARLWDGAARGEPSLGRGGWTNSSIDPLDLPRCDFCLVKQRSHAGWDERWGILPYQRSLAGISTFDVRCENSDER